MQTVEKQEVIQSSQYLSLIHAAYTRDVSPEEIKTAVIATASNDELRGYHEEDLTDTIDDLRSFWGDPERVNETLRKCKEVEHITGQNFVVDLDVLGSTYFNSTSKHIFHTFPEQIILFRQLLAQGNTVTCVTPHDEQEALEYKQYLPEELQTIPFYTGEYYHPTRTIMQDLFAEEITVDGAFNQLKKQFPDLDKHELQRMKDESGIKPSNLSATYNAKYPQFYATNPIFIDNSSATTKSAITLGVPKERVIQFALAYTEKGNDTSFENEIQKIAQTQPATMPNLRRPHMAEIS
jgi:hypothetical protein